MLDRPTRGPAPETFPAPDWAPDRWKNVARTYTPADVRKLQGSLPIRHSFAEYGARRLWELLHTEDYLPTLGTFTGNQAVQQVKAELKAIYLSGWQVAADANTSGNTYPDQSLYPVDSGPAVVRRINKALQRADQIQTLERFEGKETPELDYFVPIVADAEAGFGGALNTFELMKAMIEAGAAAVHFEDQLASEKKCGHLGGKVLVPTRTFVRTLNAARLAADVMGVPTVIMARTDAEAARLITSDVDEHDAPFITGERTEEGFYRLKGGFDAAIARGLAYAPYADLIWCETSTPSLEDARRFAEAIRKEYPEQMLAYNCSPSFNWARHMGEDEMAHYQRELGAMGYKYQFITLAGFHNTALTTFELARAYAKDGMTAYSRLQQAEFAAEKDGFTATRHQREVGTGYFDAVSTAIAQGSSSTLAMEHSTETAQF
ncbi:isocitrate lyase [Lutibaculum baratangense]|uniref:Isocitrate lyase n=1 Tax=Lutibaculum baratangense AMV1 TaxID=631454 RepID=V4RLU6_9HYPH|nr:isocitrate lyase [Lutibaculum baratangense]ESR26991.1 Isocitrate lyase [Lutibaculum baratangense AMV1]